VSALGTLWTGQGRAGQGRLLSRVLECLRSSSLCRMSEKESGQGLIVNTR